MVITIIIYSLIILYIIVKGFYISRKPLGNIQNKESLQDSISLTALPFYLNQGKINLFIIFIIFLFIFINNLPNFIIIISDILENINNNAQCAGVLKLVELAKEDIPLPKSKQIGEYQSSISRTIFKYNFDLLKRDSNFFKNRSAIIELYQICLDLDILHTKNIKTINNLLSLEKISALNTKKGIIEMRENIKDLYNLNLFIKQNLKFINEQFGIPLYHDLYNKIFISIYFEKVLNKDIINNNINPCLSEDLSRNVNYFNVNLGINQNKDLITLKQDLTVNASTADTDRIKIIDQKSFNKKLINYRVISEILLKNGEILKVIDQDVVNDRSPGNQNKDLLVGGVGIIETYINYTRGMSSMESVLNSSNTTLKSLEELLLEPNFEDEEVLLHNIQELSSNFNNEHDPSFSLATIYKTRVIDSIIITDANSIFKDQILINEDISSKYNIINNIFLNQLKKDSLMLKDIPNQQNNMVVNYTKLIQIMESTDEDKQKYFNNKIKNKILKASVGIFSNKRPRS